MQIIRRDGEGFEEFLRRYKRELAQSGILRDHKRSRFYLSPGEARRQKQQAAERRRRRKRTNS
ncbi:MAG: 30S ribosomal protein S21 [Chloroflexi bacterium]|nr:30S ribosomal protein S21 [Chloroflexota bacterium]